MSILVTGASGHVGFTLVQHLIRQGRRVRTLTRYRTPYLAPLPVEFVDGDLCEKESLHAAFAGVDVVYHVAASISLLPGAAPHLTRVNVLGTRNIVDLCREHGVRRLVYFSTLEALRTDPLDSPVDELRPLVGDDFPLAYSRTKAMATSLVLNAMASGLDAVVIYPSAVIGPNDYRQAAGNWLLLQLAFGNLPVLLPGGYNWVDVRDVVAGAVQAEQYAPPGASYVLSNQWASLQDIARMVHAAGGPRPPRLLIPAAIAGWAALPAEWLARLLRKHAFFTRHALYTVRVNNHQVSHQRATADLGYQPRPLQETVADTLAWFEQIGKSIRNEEPSP